MGIVFVVIDQNQGMKLIYNRSQKFITDQVLLLYHDIWDGVGETSINCKEHASSPPPPFLLLLLLLQGRS